MKGLFFACMASIGFVFTSWGGIGWSAPVVIEEDRGSDWTPLECAKVLCIRLVHLHQRLGFDSVISGNFFEAQIRATELIALRIVHMLRHDGHHGDLDDIAPPTELRNVDPNSGLYRRLREAEFGDLEGGQSITEYAQPLTHADLVSIEAHINDLLYWVQSRVGDYANQEVDENLFLDADLLNALLRVRSIFTRVSEFVQREIREADDEPAPVHAAEDMHAGSDASTLFLITLGYCFLHSS
ncbi:MAG: hypothetical protein Tsb0018_02010 [Opitutales bacterium]